MDMDDLYIEMQEKLIGEYLDEHPNATEAEAEAYAESHLEERVNDHIADQADAAYDRWKDERCR